MRPLVSTQLVFQNYFEDLDDSAFYCQELALGDQAEGLGFDALWIVEHHFEDYAMSPDNFATLAWFAARTKRIGLGVGAAILPWNDPVRVAEKAILLDHLSQGRGLLAMGRGLAKKEYRGFRQDMGEARERFDEAAAMIAAALDTGTCVGAGPFYPQPEVELRPRPFAGYQDRLFAVAMSPDSVDAAANIGAAMMSFVQGGPDKLLVPIAKYRALYEAAHRRSAPLVVLSDLTYCHESAATAREMAHTYLSQYYLSVVKHYDFAGDHFATTAGYQSYAEGAALIRAAGLEAAAEAYVGAQIWGTPGQIIDRVRARMDVIGPYATNWIFSYAGLPFDAARNSMSLFAREVAPAIRELLAPSAVAA